MYILFKNFVNLTEQEIKLVWKERNEEKVRKNMINKEVIPFENHINWIENLKNREDCKYYLVYFDKTPIGVCSYTDIDDNKKDSEWGYYIFEEKFGYGAVIEYYLIENFFKNMGYEKLYCRVESNNLKVFNMHINNFGFIKDEKYNITLQNGDLYFGESIIECLWQEKREKILKLVNKLFNLEKVIWQD